VLLFVCTRLRSRLDHRLPVSVASNLSSGHVDEALVVYINEAEKIQKKKKGREEKRGQLSERQSKLMSSCQKKKIHL
jgi:hypothetical protein